MRKHATPDLQLQSEPNLSTSHTALSLHVTVVVVRGLLNNRFTTSTIRSHGHDRSQAPEFHNQSEYRTEPAQAMEPDQIASMLPPANLRS